MPKQRSTRSKGWNEQIHVTSPRKRNSRSPIDHTAYIKAVSAATKLNNMEGIAGGYCTALGFDYFLYAVVLPLPLSAPEIVVITTYPDAWRKRYVEQNYAAIDPVVIYSSNSITPIYWDALNLPDDKSVSMMEDAADHGLCVGLTVPLANRLGANALFSIASKQNSQEIHNRLREQVSHIQLFATYMHETVMRYCQVLETENGSRKLTKREKQCLMWAAEGKTAWEIGQILSVAERTVVFHLNNAVEKLSAANRQQAIARAIALGEIRPHNFALFLTSS